MKFRVTLAGTGEEFGCAPDQHLLQGMQGYRVGQPLLKAIPVGCRGGGCGVCRVRIVSGEFEAKKMSRKHVTTDEQAQGHALACRVFPRSDLVVEVVAAHQAD
ncbi:MAG: 2Fe-2S iron-sulfur cluster-binding protein [Halioglobus sp.]|nr:2Fe-2S iron-sulfur cluster-binding protein [Halioglobus sp.]